MKSSPTAIAVPADGEILETVAGRKTHSVGCVHGTKRVERAEAEEPCLTPEQVIELAGYIVRAEDVVGGAAEVEWSLDDGGFKMLQARPLHVEEDIADFGELWAQKPRLQRSPGRCRLGHRQSAASLTVSAKSHASARAMCS